MREIRLSADSSDAFERESSKTSETLSEGPFNVNSSRNALKLQTFFLRRQNYLLLFFSSTKSSITELTLLASPKMKCVIDMSPKVYHRLLGLRSSVSGKQR